MAGAVIPNDYPTIFVLIMAQVVFFKSLGITKHPDGKNEIYAMFCLIIAIFGFVPLEFHVYAIVTTKLLIHTSTCAKTVIKSKSAKAF